MSQKPSKKLFVITEQALNFLHLWRMVALSFERLFGLKFIPRSNVELMYTIDRYKWWGKWSLLKVPDSHALSLQKTRPKMDICCHIRAGATQSSIFSLGRFQKYLRPRRLTNFYSWPFFHRRIVTNLLLLYPWEDFDELDSLVLPVLKLTTNACDSTDSCTNQHYSIHIPLCCKLRQECVEALTAFPPTMGY